MRHAKKLKETSQWAMLVSERIANAILLPMALDIAADALLVMKGILMYMKDAKV